MKKLIKLLSIVTILGVSFWGCQQSQMPVESDLSNSDELLKPPVLVSAVLKMNAEHISFDATNYPCFDLRIQKISTPWEEMSATWEYPWTNDGGDYFAAPEVSHLVCYPFTYPGILEVDITSLWTDGIPPLGIILSVDNPADDDKRIKFTSREGGYTSEVVVTYAKGPKTITETYPVIEDTWISNRYDWSTRNFGDQNVLYAGNIAGEPNKEKKTLLKFEVPQGCETAYGYNARYSTCFLDDGFGNWGWTNGALGSGEYTLELYAGAGQCDTEKGTYVGTVTLNYVGSTLTATYNLEDDFTMNEAHLYVGNDKYPVDKKGNPTVAPGQYTVVDDDLGGVVSHPITVSGLSGSIYVIAHAVVCGDF